MGGATKARPEDLKPILDGYYKLAENNIIDERIVNIKRLEFNSYELSTKDAYFSCYSRIQIDNVLLNSVYLGSNIDSINLLYKE